MAVALDPFSETAYQVSQQVYGTQNVETPLQEIIVAESNGFKMIAVDSEGVRYISFRGTSNAVEAAADSFVVPTEMRAGELVHTGFNAAYQGFEPAIETLASTAPGEIVFTGHSLGGAIANLAARDYSSVAGGPAHLITFGAPSVGNSQFATGLEGTGVEITRYVNGSDIVPESLRGIYTHAGPETAIASETEGLGAMLADHSLTGYSGWNTGAELTSMQTEVRLSKLIASRLTAIGEFMSGVGEIVTAIQIISALTPDLAGELITKYSAREEATQDLRDAVEAFNNLQLYTDDPTTIALARAQVNEVAIRTRATADNYSFSEYVINHSQNLGGHLLSNQIIQYRDAADARGAASDAYFESLDDFDASQAFLNDTSFYRDSSIPEVGGALEDATDLVVDPITGILGFLGDVLGVYSGHHPEPNTLQTVTFPGGPPMPEYITNYRVAEKQHLEDIGVLITNASGHLIIASSGELWSDTDFIDDPNLFGGYMEGSAAAVEQALAQELADQQATYHAVADAQADMHAVGEPLAPPAPVGPPTPLAPSTSFNRIRTHHSNVWDPVYFFHRDYKYIMAFGVDLRTAARYEEAVIGQQGVSGHLYEHIHELADDYNYLGYDSDGGGRS